MAFRPEKRSFQRPAFLGRASAEDRKLRKDPFGGPCLEGTLQKLLIPPGKQVSESSPVAGAIQGFNPCLKP
jgi:hypothetical protein